MAHDMRVFHQNNCKCNFKQFLLTKATNICGAVVEACVFNRCLVTASYFKIRSGYIVTSRAVKSVVLFVDPLISSPQQRLNHSGASV